MSLIVEAVTKAYGRGARKRVALDEVSIEVRDSEFLSIVGPSGCGKTTLLKIIAGLLPPTSGRVTFSTPQRHGKLRAALVFQDHGLLPWRNVLENVALGLRFQSADRDTAIERAQRFTEQVGLGDFLDYKPHQLSMGMRQRVGIARAFAADPEILLLDEPYGALDAQTRLVLQQELLRIWQDHRKTIVHVTHDIEEAILLSDRIVVLGGRPARVRETIDVPFVRPRPLTLLTSPEAREIHQRIWQILEEEVRENLCVRRE